MSVASQVEDQIVKILSIYSAYTRDLLKEFTMFLLTNDSVAASGRNELLGRLGKIAEVAIGKVNTEAERISDEVGRLFISTALTADTASEISDSDLDLLSDLMDAHNDRMLHGIKNQMQADVDQILATYNRYRIRVAQSARRMGSIKSAIISERAKVANDVELYHRDALGRRRDSEQYVFTELRYGVYRWFNISMVYVLSKLGYEFGRMDAPGNQNDGRRVRLDEFEDLESQFFHPNSRALLVP